jgi:hypothetical protein
MYDVAVCCVFRNSINIYYTQCVLDVASQLLCHFVLAQLGKCLHKYIVWV